ncbi:MAG TPA: cupin domain-containing protein [Planctomycetaceae bacterium]|nr:cupin domain-containing protein [Planctomycetaceae bacterium]
MACVTISATGRRIEDPEQISAFLAPYGIWYERWDVAGRIGSDADNDAILSAFAGEIERLKARGGYVTADVINVSPATPGLEAMLARFSREHTHDDDEVRFVVRGRGIFHIHPDDDNVFAIQVEAGDLINVPAGTRHWFDLCAERVIHAIRLFRDPAGWSPNYTDSDLHLAHLPVCWGPAWLPAVERSESPVRL